MKVLLDTSVLLRLAGGTAPLAESARTAILEADELFVSAISRAEIGIKVSAGKLRLPVREQVFWDGLRETLQATELGFHCRHAALLSDLPLHHRDPFDRMIVCQCLAEDLCLATNDPLLERYGIAIV